MKRSRALVSQALETLKSNVERTGDPMGFRNVYWTRWAGGLDLPRGGDCILWTARMYQMLPYVIQTTGMVERVKLLLAVKGAGRIVAFGNRLVGRPVIRVKAWWAGEVAERSAGILRGITGALAAAGVHPGYLHETEPYSGVLLHDLGLEEAAVPHMRKVYGLLKNSGAKEAITVDPHTTFMLREVYPRHIPGFDLDVRHYLDVLAQSDAPLCAERPAALPARMVLHDSCVMTRDLDMVAPARTVLRRLGVEVVEPESGGKNTACCGGPVEYAFADLSRSISCIRARELASAGTDVVSVCPICLINLMKHEGPLGIRVWDMGEILDCAVRNGKERLHG